jgi:Zn-finger nucleic acid-binding protein
MTCPSCKDTALVMSERSGVEIDYCPKCRGVWLDRGELDKIIDRAERETPVASPPPTNYPQQPPPQRPAYREDLDDSKYGYQYQQPRRRKSFWSELFD